ncbi:MAG: hypothetical protein HYT14_02580 [Candidatus Liptonbacteria bacterium]|nr:hypothetical protein [Candidatus Liptonbacteria bacterium]
MKGKEISQFGEGVGSAPETEEGRERAEFRLKIEQDEQTMMGGVLSKLNEVPASLKRGIMVLAAAGAIFSATEAGAGEAWQKQYGYEGWQKHYGYGEAKKESGTTMREGAVKAADLAEARRVQEIDQQYQQKLHQIRLTVIDPAARDQAIQRLDQRRTNEYLKAWMEREVKAHAAEVKSRQYRE